MAWPTNKPQSGAFAADSNSIAQSRPELKTMSDAVNDIVDFIDTSAIANNKILKYNSTSGALEFVDEAAGSEQHIQGGEGITVTKEDSVGQHEIAFSGSFENNDTQYFFNSGSFFINNNVNLSTNPLIKSGNSNNPGMKFETEDGAISSIEMLGGTNGNIVLTPHGTGDVKLGNFTFDADQSVGAGQDNYVLTYDNSTTKISLEVLPSAGISNVVEDTTPQLGGDLDGQDNTIKNVNFEDYQETVHQLAFATNITPDPTNGPIQEITLTNNVSFGGFSTETDGTTITLIIKQDGTGNRTFVENLDSGNRMLFAGGTSTLSTAGGAIDIMTITFAGGIYYASLSTNFS